MKISYIIRGDEDFTTILYRYMACKLFCIRFGHEYMHRSGFDPMVTEPKILTDEIMMDELNPDVVSSFHILLDGQFQKSCLYRRHRNELVRQMMNRENRDILSFPHHEEFLSTYLFRSNDEVYDRVIYIRLQSDVAPPSFYMDKSDDAVIFLSTDDNPQRYMDFFGERNFRRPKDLPHEIAVLRDCRSLVHMNDPFSWIISFLSEKDERIIGMNPDRGLGYITQNDRVIHVKTLSEYEVKHLDVCNQNMFPVSIAIPDECVVDEIPHKDTLMAPGDNGEKKYTDMYRRSRFAMTKKRGGWDRLRHYEILMNGCIPIFENLDACPRYTLTTYPKHLHRAAVHLYKTWRENDDTYIRRYNVLCQAYLEHTRRYCTISALTDYFLGRFQNNVRHILMIVCHEGLNYLRESLWIGLKRRMRAIGGLAVEYGNISIIYDEGESILTKRISRDAQEEGWTDERVKEGIRTHFWDVIIFGKVGPDEILQDYPLLDLVVSHYRPEEIAFLYGGDEIQNMKKMGTDEHYTNVFNVHIPYRRYIDHVNRLKKLGRCFVREFDAPEAFLHESVRKRNMIITNPFTIDIEDKLEYTAHDYMRIREMMQLKSIEDVLQMLYPPTGRFYTYEDFYSRLTRGFIGRHTDEHGNVFKELYKIGDGGDGKNCFICTAPYRHDFRIEEEKRKHDPESRMKNAMQILKSLEENGYNGHFYLQIGGFPTPRGTEMKYAGVPYAFKILLMEDMYRRGFEKVIWLDAPARCIKNPQFLFDQLDKNEVIASIVQSSFYDNMTFQETIEILNEWNENDIREAMYINTRILGMNMKSPVVREIMEDYYRMMAMGLPFISIFPEEIVITSLFHKYKQVITNRDQMICGSRLYAHYEMMSMEDARSRGVFFYMVQR